MNAQKWPAVGLTIALLGVAALVWLWLDDRPAPVASLPAAAEIPAPVALETAPLETAPAPPIDGEPDVAASQEAERRSAPYPRHAYSNCRWGQEPVPGEGMEGVYRCLDSPHHEYSNETLEVLAYGDPEAARVLAMRLRNTDFGYAMQLALRSIALSGGDTEILFSAEAWQVPGRNDEPTPLEQVSHQYVVSSLRNLVRHGAYSGYPPYVTRIRQMSEDSDATMQALDDFVHQLYDEIRQIERDVTGNSRIGGDDDV